MSSWSTRRMWTVGFGSFLAILVFSKDWPAIGALSLFLTLAGAATLTRDLVPKQARQGYLLVAIAGLTLAIFVVRKSPALVLLADPGNRAHAINAILTENLGVLGLSYSYLRAVYGLFDSRQWDVKSLLAYYLFAPTFFSGPVMNPDEAFAPALKGREAFQGGLARVTGGVVRISASFLLLQWIPLSNEAGVEAAMSWPLWMLWLGVVLSGFWLYLNFSGFSEVFIGLSLWFGVKAPENFDHPYGATNLTAFWQRWHISLGLWLRTILYNPISRRVLAGSPAVKFTTSLLLPLGIMTICGAWHMFTPAFLLWGLLHGIGLAVHEIWRRFADARMPHALQSSWAYRGAAWVFTHAFVGMTWVLFLPTMRLPFGTRLSLLAALFGEGP